MTKRCRRCHLEKPVAEFGRSKANKDGRQAYCDGCKRAYQRERHERMTPDERAVYLAERRRWHDEHPERSRASRARANARRRERMAADPAYREERRRARRASMLKRKYGLPIEDVQRMLDEQEGVCAVCREREPTQVDHCHTTNATRALLCGVCNTAAGVLERRRALLPSLLAYIERWDEEVRVRNVDPGAGPPMPAGPADAVNV